MGMITLHRAQNAEVTSGTSPVLPVAIECIDANTFWLRLRGLLGRTLETGQGLLLTPCNEIHTCFMGYAIDAVYLSREGEVLRVDAQLAPWKFCKSEKGARSILELPAGDAARLGICVGGKLTK